MPKKIKKEVPPKRITTDAGIFNIMERGASLTSAIRESLTHSSARLKSTPGIMYGALASNQKLVLPIPEFAFAYALNSRALLSGRIFDIIGADGCGKTSLIFTMFGWVIPYNSPCAHVETEGKPMDKDRILRCLHANRAIAEQMFNTISWMQSFEIVDAVNQLENWLMTIRDKKNSASYVPDTIPAFIALDTFSKLMAPAEAVGYSMYGDIDEDEEKPEKGKAKGKKKKKQVIQELGAGSNMGHSKLAHIWSRRLPSLLSKYNAVLILARHQNQKVDMSGGAGGASAFIPIEVKEQSNRTSIGGQAFCQSAAYEIVLTRDKFLYAQMNGEKQKVSQLIRMSVAKNSYGPPRHCMYAVTLVPRKDTEDTQEPTLDFSSSLPDILHNTRLLHTSLKDGNLITCKELNVSDASAAELNLALRNRPEMMDDLSRRLGFTASGVAFKAPRMSPMFALPTQESEVAVDSKIE